MLTFLPRRFLMARRLMPCLLMAVILAVQGCSKSEEAVPVEREFKSRLPRTPPGGAPPVDPAKKQPSKKL
jgi:hypothetical protein